MSSKRLRVLGLQMNWHRNASVSFYTHLQSLAWKTSELRWKACIEGVFDRASLYISANFHRVAPWTIVKFSIAEIGRIFFLPNSLGFAFQWFTVLLNNSCEASNYKFMSFILIFFGSSLNPANSWYYGNDKSYRTNSEHQITRIPIVFYDLLFTETELNKTSHPPLPQCYRLLSPPQSFAAQSGVYWPLKLLAEGKREHKIIVSSFKAFLELEEKNCQVMEKTEGNLLIL